MQAHAFEMRTVQRNQLSAVDVHGWFDFATATVYLKTVTAVDLLTVQKLFAGLEHALDEAHTGAKLTPEQFAALAKILPLAAHEYTHFVDGTSTLWGLRHLQLMNDAYVNSSGRGAREDRYRAAKVFHDHLRSIRLPSYYTVVNPRGAVERPWRSEISIGRTFNGSGDVSARPVLFSRFLNAHGDLIVRSPISTVSILEASAMATELRVHAALLYRAEDDFRIVEQATFGRRQMDFLYDRDLTEYSVCVHVLANELGCQDAFEAFRVAAQLTRLVLNFPMAAFKRLHEVCPVAKVLRLPDQHEFSGAIRDGLRLGDFGTVYYLLCAALPRQTYESDEKIEAGIVVALQELGLDVDAVIDASASEARTVYAHIRGSPLQHVRKLADAGFENFGRVGSNRRLLRFDELNIPPALLGDDAVVPIYGGAKNLLKDYSVADGYSELDDGYSWVNRFAEACL